MRWLARGLILALAVPVPAQGSTVRRARPFQLRLDHRDDLFADDAEATLEQVWKLATRHFTPDRKMAGRRLKVFVYAARPAYEKAAKRLKLGHLTAFQGFADGRSMTCHILRHPAPGWDGPGMDLANRHTLAHEAMHLVISLCCKNRGNFLPKWVNEGLPLWLEGEVLRAGGWAGPRLKNPQEGYALKRSKELLAQGSWPGLAEVSQDRFGKLSAFDQYHPCRMLWWWLAEEHAAAIPGLIAAVRDTEASAAVPAILRSALRAAVGDLDKADQRFRDFIQKLPQPQLPTLPALPADAKGRPGTPDYQPGSPAVRWMGSTTRTSYRVETELVIRGKGAQQADLVFGRIGRGWLRLSLVPGSGIYLLQRRDPEGGGAGAWQVLARQREVPGLVGERRLKLSLRVSRKTLRLVLDGEEVIRHEGEDWDLRGRFGLGGPRGAILQWTAARLR